MAATVKKEEEKTREEQTQEEKLSGIASIMGKNQYTPGDMVQQAQQLRIKIIRCSRRAVRSRLMQ